MSARSRLMSPTILTSAENAALLRQDFASFIARAFHHLNPAKRYEPNWHIDLMASKLTDVKEGRLRRLIINLPPRNMKSICASIAFPAWWLGHDPTINIVCASYGQDLADKLALDTRNIMVSSWYQDLFPTRLSSGRSAIEDFQTTQGGGRMATSVTGVMTGRGGDVLIIDDPLKSEEAYSELARTKTNAWYDSTAYTRLNSKREGAIILIMQRLHLDDLVGHVLEKEVWEVISFPAIAQVDEIHTFMTPFGVRTVRRLTGEALHPKLEPLESLKVIRETLGEYNFAGQYLQSPVPLGGGIVKTEWLNYVERESIPLMFDYVIQSWDTASKAKHLADYSVCSTWGVKDRQIYLLDVWRKKVNFPDLRRAALEKYRQHRPTTVLIEDHVSGTQLLQELQQEGIWAVIEQRPIGDKAVRLHAQCALIESGAVHLPAQAPWLTDYVHELTSFPACRYDDQVDSTTQALAYIGHNVLGPYCGLLQYMKDECENRRGK